VAYTGGYRNIHQDLREEGIRCGKHRVARLMRSEGLRSQTGYRRRPGHYSGKPAVVSPNHLDRQFDAPAPNVAWVTDITYIRTYEGWLYLAVVIDLFSRQVVGLVDEIPDDFRSGAGRSTGGRVATKAVRPGHGSF